MITSIDHAILLWIEENLRFDWLTPIWKIITYFGEGGYFWIALCVLLILIKKTRKIGILMLVSLAINALLVNVWIKNMVARVRPYDEFSDLTRLIEAQKDWSFPSGHTSASFSCAAGLTFALEKENRKWCIPCWIMACLIAFSRLYLGVHYPTDVFGGIIVGTCSAILAYFIVKKIEEGIEKKKAVNI